MKIRDALVVEGLGLRRAGGHGVVKRTDGLPQPHRPLKDLARHPAHRRAGRMGIVLGGRNRAGKAEGEGGRRRGPQAREPQWHPPRGLVERTTAYDTGRPLHSAREGGILFFDIRRDPRKRARQPGGATQGAVPNGRSRSGDVASVWNQRQRSCPARTETAPSGCLLRKEKTPWPRASRSPLRPTIPSTPITISGATAIAGGSPSPSTSPGGRRSASASRWGPRTSTRPGRAATRSCASTPRREVVSFPSASTAGGE